MSRQPSGEGFAAGRTSSAASRRAVAAAISSTAASNAAALRAAGARNPLIFLTYCSAAARTSWSVTWSAYGGRNVLILRHILRTLCSISRARLGGPDGGSRSIKPEQRPDAHGDPWGQRRQAADREQHAWQERRPVQRIVPDRQRLSVPAEQHLLMRHQPRQPHRVHVHVIHAGASRAGQLLPRGVRRGAEP